MIQPQISKKDASGIAPFYTADNKIDGQPYTRAHNFIHAVDRYVDPRTGLYIINLPLVRLHVCNLAGPVLDLSLKYFPLSVRNEGFGKGFSLTLTRYDPISRRLMLSTGEEYVISSQGRAIQQKKFRNFLFKKKDENHYQIIHKSGLTENLEKKWNVFVPVSIVTPDGREMKLTWKEYTSSVRPVKITDENGICLCSFEYPNDTGAPAVKINVLPCDDKAGYSLRLEFTDLYLTTLEGIFGAESQVWKFSYKWVGAGGIFRVVTEIISPAGLKETVSYNTNFGMAYPDGAGFLALPCIHEHIIMPGGSQPAIITWWEWTAENYLGRNAELYVGLESDDSLMRVLIPQYTYGSTEKRIDPDTGDVLGSVTRRYNSYHQQISESTLRDGKTYSLFTDYYSGSGLRFDEQPEQYVLPRGKTESWHNGTSARSHTTRWKFDEWGNPLWQVTPDGTVTEYTYYPAGGDGSDCPADPHGFVRYLKSKTVTPPQLNGDEPATVTLCKWRKLTSLPGDSYFVVADSATHITGTVSTEIAHQYYSDRQERLSFGRVKQRITSLFPDRNVKPNEIYTGVQTFRYELRNEGLFQSESLVTHDGLTATRCTIRHAALGLLVNETDVQNVSVGYTYDRAGRMLSRTVAPGTHYERKSGWQYIANESGLIKTETDDSGNQTRLFFDGLGRQIKSERLDRDGVQTWFEVSSNKYSPTGELAVSTGLDWLTQSAESCRIECKYTYDGWGSLAEETFSHGVRHVYTFDPVQLMSTTRSEGTAVSSGTRTTKVNARTFLPSMEFFSDTEGNSQETCLYTRDGLGRLRVLQDPMDFITRLTWDDCGRILTRTLADGSVVSYTYAPHLTGKQPASVSVTGIDSDGKKKTWILGTQTFDGFGRLTEQTCGGRVTRYVYEGASTVPSAVTLPSGKTVQYSCIPELGNVVKRVATDELTQSFSYDPATGQILSAWQGLNMIRNEQYPSGALKCEQFSSGLLTNYTRMLSGTVLTYEDVTGSETLYLRDTYGRINSLKDAHLIAELEYDPLGRLSGQTVTDIATQGKLATDIKYDDFGREDTRTVTDSNNISLTLALSRFPDGLLRRRILYISGKRIRVEDYSYDKRRRLTRYRAKGPENQLPTDGYGNHICDRRYRYDALNNLLSVKTLFSSGEGDTCIFHYADKDDPTQLSRISHTFHAYPQTTELRYDADGRMIRDEAGRTLTYDTLGRLTGSNSNGVSQVLYRYDALNRIITQTLNDADIRSLYYRDGELVNELTELDPGHYSLIKYGHDCLAVKKGSSIILTATDALGSLLWSRDFSAERQLHQWEPYGAGRAPDFLPGYTGERVDPVTGHYHLGNGYRAYSPALMRFTCPDSLSPFGAGGINPYAYCAGDPVNFSDPSGHISWQGWLSIGIGVFGLGLALLTGGLSIAAAGGLIAALEGASTVALVVGGLGVVADVTSIASGALEDVNPEASSVLGWTSLGAGAAGLAGGLGKMGMQFSRGAVRARTPVVLGGTMKNLDSLGRDIFLFDDVYKGENRLNIVAHGALQADGTALLSRTSGAGMSADELFNILRSRVTLTDYQNIRTIMCHSGSGSAASFGQKLSTLSGLPVKSYHGPVTGNFEVNKLNQLLLEATVRFGDAGMSHMQAVFAQKRFFTIHKINPYPLLSLDHFNWTYNPVRFTP